MSKSSQAELIRRYLSWDKVAARLAKYHNIRACYDMDEMKDWTDRAPYYCHYLAWRMGTWPREYVFQLLDGLIGECQELAGWAKSVRLTDGRFDSFWSDLWELQVAEALVRRQGVDEVSWLAQGPDIKVRIAGEECFVECYVPKKFFRTEQYVAELLRAIHPWFRVEHDWGRPIYLPEGRTEGEFLDELFEQFLDPQFVRNLECVARGSNPVEIRLPPGTANLTIEFADPYALAPGDATNAHSTCEHMVLALLRDAIRNKAEENRLSEHHPNVVFVNMLLARDFVSGITYAQMLGKQLPSLPVSANGPPPIDAIGAFSCGVDKRLCVSSGDYWYLKKDEHPFGRSQQH